MTQGGGVSPAPHLPYLVGYTPPEVGFGVKHQNPKLEPQIDPAKWVPTSPQLVQVRTPGSQNETLPLGGVSQEGGDKSLGVIWQKRVGQRNYSSEAQKNQVKKGKKRRQTEESVKPKKQKMACLFCPLPCTPTPPPQVGRPLHFSGFCLHLDLPNSLKHKLWPPKADAQH